MTECPGRVDAAAVPTTDEQAVSADQDLATLSLRYRQELEEHIHSIALGRPGLEAGFLLLEPGCTPPTTDTDGLLAALDTCTRYELMALLR
jgi:hypothetical protein